MPKDYYKRLKRDLNRFKKKFKDVDEYDLQF